MCIGQQFPAAPIFTLGLQTYVHAAHRGLDPWGSVSVAETTHGGHCGRWADLVETPSWIIPVTGSSHVGHVRCRIDPLGSRSPAERTTWVRSLA